MPHFIIEHGNSLVTPEARADALQIAIRTGAACGFMAVADLKARLHECDDFVHADGCAGFLHVTVRLLVGRTPEQKAMLTTALRNAFAERFPDVGSMSFEACDMEPISYRKRLAASAD